MNFEVVMHFEKKDILHAAYSEKWNLVVGIYKIT